MSHGSYLTEYQAFCELAENTIHMYSNLYNDKLTPIKTQSEELYTKFIYLENKIKNILPSELLKNNVRKLKYTTFIKYLPQEKHELSLQYSKLR